MTAAFFDYKNWQKTKSLARTIAEAMPLFAVKEAEHI
jgi:hypothetical protein